MMTDTSPTLSRLSLFLVSVALLGACASAPPQVADVTTHHDASRNSEIVQLPASHLANVWDGRVELALQARMDATTALVTVERRSEEFHYKSCRKMSISPTPDRSQPTQAAYQSDLDLDVDDRIETFQATVDSETLTQLAANPKSAILLCDDRFELARLHRERIADFVETWTGERPALPSPGEAETSAADDPHWAGATTSTGAE